jgi:hypothetical protein
MGGMAKKPSRGRGRGRGKLNGTIGKSDDSSNPVAEGSLEPEIFADVIDNGFQEDLYGGSSGSANQYHVDILSESVQNVNVVDQIFEEEVIGFVKNIPVEEVDYHLPECGNRIEFSHS